MPSRFLECLKRANLTTHRMMSEPARMNGVTIMVAVDDLSQTSFARSGGTSPGTEAALFVNEEEFRAAGGKKGSVITFDMAGSAKSALVQKISDFQGVLYLQLAPFKP